ncbi:MAG: dTDP-4-dehydrorhamnose reductase [Bacteroidales bacterium]|nr:dTDP-4-dehydrorhamnose reductase [Bacteroidales bacterium]
MKNILVTGSNGQLGNELRNLSIHYPNFNMIFTDLPELDITERIACESFIKKHNIDFLINCAAYTAVDKAESEPELAFKLNKEAPAILTELAAKHHFTLVHFSTDYIFDGQHFEPYTEQDTPNPSSVYGKSKLEGETAILNSASCAIIIRTSWLYSAYGHNFVKTILRLAREKEIINIVYDQVGTPTYAADLAKCILDMLKSRKIEGQHIYNYSNEGVCSWYDFANAIIELRGLQCKIVPIRSADYPTAAPRPPYSVLDKSKIKKDVEIHIPWWKDSLALCLQFMQKQI